MANLPADGFPGPLNRLQLTDKYPATIQGGDATYNDIIARNMKNGNDEDEDFVDETTTEAPSDEDEKTKNIEKRSMSDSIRIIFTRVGVYTMIESRLDA